jgi:uncharacterized LabA/DUF88 family protein
VSLTDRYAILLDGEYVKKMLGKRHKHFPDYGQVMAEVARIKATPELAPLQLYRVFYHTAEPLTGTTTHPLDKSAIDFGVTPAFRQNTQLIDRLENQPNMAVRRGTLVHQGWQLTDRAVKQLVNGTKAQVDPADVVPKIQQKGVDMRIGLDIASLALKQLVSTIVLVTGDSDLVPAMRFARREGLRVYLDTLSNLGVRPELKLHADIVL